MFFNQGWGNRNDDVNRLLLVSFTKTLTAILSRPERTREEPRESNVNRRGTGES